MPVIKSPADEWPSNSYHGGLSPEATIISRHRSDVPARCPKKKRNIQLRFYHGQRSELCPGKHMLSQREELLNTHQCTSIDAQPLPPRTRSET